MFTHYLTGCLMYLVFSDWCGWQVTWQLLLGGAICGALPDLLSLFCTRIRLDKWSHKHRDNLTHSLLFPALVFAITILVDIKSATVVSLTLLTHPLLDTFGVGWGVKLFAPISDVTVKLGHIKGKWLYTQKEIDTEAEKHGDENWVRNIYNVFWCIKTVFDTP